VEEGAVFGLEKGIEAFGGLFRVKEGGEGCAKAHEKGGVYRGILDAMKDDMFFHMTGWWPVGVKGVGLWDVCTRAYGDVIGTGVKLV